MKWEYEDGGRKAAGFKGSAGDCAVRAICVATNRDYQTVYDQLNHEALRERPRKGRTRSSARNGVATRTLRRYLDSIGWAWTPTMQIGSGCTVHVRAEELPEHGRGPLILSLSKHLTCVIDGFVLDTHDPSRGGTRCVYGYWQERG